MQRGRSRRHARRGSGLTHHAAAILAAGGRGRRAQRSTLKQFQPLAARPLITWSLEALVAFGCTPVVVVVPPDALSAARSICGDAEGVVYVGGGDTRQASVAAGLNEVRQELVVVHDAARPFVRKDAIERAIGALAHADASVPALPVDETIKRVAEGRVVATVERADLWSAQTPQAFRADVLRRAHARAAQEGFFATDDAQLVERYGGTVVVVEGSRANLKLTYPEDFVLAESMLRSRW